MPESVELSTRFLPMLLEGIMLIAIAGLWFMWWRNAKRQRLVESMLADSARQLQEATLHLQQAMQLINKSTDSARPRPKETRSRTAEKDDVAKKDARIEDMLSMQRDGRPVEDIARTLGLPLSQVRLMLKLHANRAH